MGIKKNKYNTLLFMPREHDIIRVYMVLQDRVAIIVGSIVPYIL